MVKMTPPPAGASPSLEPSSRLNLAPNASQGLRNGTLGEITMEAQIGSVRGSHELAPFRFLDTIACGYRAQCK